MSDIIKIYKSNCYKIILLIFHHSEELKRILVEVKANPTPKERTLVLPLASGNNGKALTIKRESKIIMPHIYITYPRKQSINYSLFMDINKRVFVSYRLYLPPQIKHGDAHRSCRLGQCQSQPNAFNTQYFGQQDKTRDEENHSA